MLSVDRSAICRVRSGQSGLVSHSSFVSWKGSVHVLCTTYMNAMVPLHYTSLNRNSYTYPKQGPIVRIAPDELSLADVSAAREIYKASFLWADLAKWPYHYSRLTCILGGIDRRIVPKIRMVSESNDEWDPQSMPLPSKLYIDRMISLSTRIIVLNMR